MNLTKNVTFKRFFTIVATRRAVEMKICVSYLVNITNSPMRVTHARDLSSIKFPKFQTNFGRMRSEGQHIEHRFLKK